MTEMTNSIIHIHKVLRSRDTTDKNIQQTLICALGHHDLAPTQRRCEALPTMHCDLGATLYIIDFSALVAHCSAGLRSVRRSVN